VSSGANFFLKKALGEDFLQSLEKFELYKPGTRTVIDHEEVKTALKIVPRVIMSLLIQHLTPMEIGQTKDIPLEITQSNPPDGILQVTKHERDVYSGHIESSTEKYPVKVVAEFKYRSLPGVGLIIMSTFEMYDAHDLEKESPQATPDMQQQVQRMIDERLALNDLIGKVIDKKLAERDAIQQLILAKLAVPNVAPKEPLTDHFQEAKQDLKEKIVDAALKATPTSEDCPIQEVLDEVRKGSPLGRFLAKRKKKALKEPKHEYAVEMVKGENVSCPDCHQNIFNGEAFSGCVCLGDDMDKKIYLTKAEKGLKVRFGKGWDPENIEMLLEVMRRKRG
jgi:hypothetical protein